MKFIVRVLILGSLFGGGLLPAAPDAAVFNSLFLQGLLRLDERVARPKADPADFEYVLVGGITSDYLMHVGYYEAFVKELVLQGVPRAQIHLIFPPSNKTVAVNAVGFLQPQLTAIANGSLRPLVLVGHSKGAVELVQWFVNGTELSSRIEAFFSLQGAFGGSQIADMLSGDQRTLVRINGGMVSRLGLGLLQFLNRMFHKAIVGVEDLTTLKSQHRLQDWRENFAAKLNELAAKSIFVRTQSEPHLMDVRTRVGAHYLLNVGVLENDGALSFEHQHVPGMNAPLISVLGVDHGLPCGNLLARRHRYRAIAFIRALLHSLGR